MSKWIACGSVTNPKKSREYIRFYSKQDHATEEEANAEAAKWQEENRYPFIWVERVGR